jgi:ribonuclease Z
MKLTFLGTACMAPTRERNHTSILLRLNEEGILFDCGEGTQRQIRIADHRLTEVRKIMITHWHGDHVLGLPGFMTSLAASNFVDKLEIYGPAGTQERIGHMLKAFAFYSPLDYEVFEIEDGIVVDAPSYRIEAHSLDHGIPTLGYTFIEKDRRKMNLKFLDSLGIPRGPLLGRLQRGDAVEFQGRAVSPDEATFIVPGRRVAFMFDTGYCDNCLKMAENADVLISDATYASTLDDMADIKGHLTGLQAGQIASRANARLLVLTHFSNRYVDPTPVEEDARQAFPNVVSAHDFMTLNV